MILTVDAGNTRIKWGLRRDGAWVRVGALALAEAHSLAAATVSAIAGFRGSPFSMVRFKERNTSFGRCCFIAAMPNTLMPKSESGVGASGSLVFGVYLDFAISEIACLRVVMCVVPFPFADAPGGLPSGRSSIPVTLMYSPLCFGNVSG